jgi:hypothetical protein
LTSALLEPEARAELLLAARWYERRQRTLSTRFLDEIEAALAAIEEHPRSFPRIPIRGEDLEIRRCLLKTFPYALVFVPAGRCTQCHCGGSRSA